jgi:hypothetical protein
MAISQCPGQDKRFWKPGDVFESPCPACGEAIEFWKDDRLRRCRGCGATVANPRFDLGCAKWCKFAEQCLGAPAAKEVEDVAALLVAEMKQVFGEDRRRVRHALSVLDWAERILEREAADPLVVKAAAILHDIGIREAERKHGSSAARWQEAEGPPMAREILSRVGVDAVRTDHIARIIANHHSARECDTPEFRILWDADHLVNLFEEADRPAPAEACRRAERALKTAAGRSLAAERCAPGNTGPAA